MLKYFPACVAIILAFLIIPLQGISQDYPVNLDKVIISSELTDYYVEEVINDTHEDSLIGYVLKGISNNLRYAVLSPSTESAISALLKRSFPKEEGKKPLIVRLNRLYIYELDNSMRQMACVQLSISLFTREDSSYYFKFQAGVSFDRQADDVTHLHPENIGKAFQVCFDDFSRREHKGKIKDIPVKYQDILENPSREQDRFAAFTADYNKPCTFRTYYDFRDGYPNYNFPYTVKYLKSKDSTFQRVSLSGGPKKFTDSIWGFSDGRYSYMNVGKVFYRLNRSGDRFSTWIFDNDIATGLHDNSNAWAAGYMAGMMGGAIMGGLVGGLAGGLSALAGSNEGNDYMIDLYTGAITFLDPPDYLKLQSTMIFYVSGPYPGEEMTVKYNGKEVCRCKSGQYIKMELPSEYRKITLIFQSLDGPGTTQEIIPRMFNTDTYHVRIKKNREIMVNRVYEELRKGILNDITDDLTVFVNSLD